MSLEFYALQAAKARFIITIDVFPFTRSITYKLFVAKSWVDFTSGWLLVYLVRLTLLLNLKNLRNEICSCVLLFGFKKSEFRISVTRKRDVAFIFETVCVCTTYYLCSTTVVVVNSIIFNMLPRPSQGFPSFLMSHSLFILSLFFYSFSSRGGPIVASASSTLGVCAVHRNRMAGIRI